MSVSQNTAMDLNNVMWMGTIDPPMYGYNCYVKPSANFMW